MTDQPFRYTRGKRSFEHGRILMLLVGVWFLATWGVRRVKPIIYHPVAAVGILTAAAAYLISAWLLLGLICAVYVLAFIWSDSYLTHVDWRLKSFRAGCYFRHRPRRRLTANGLLNDKDPVPTISWVERKTDHAGRASCITRVRIKMSDGDEIDWWRERSRRIAQTWNARDCRINPYRRETLTPGKHHRVDKYRWLTLDFVTRDPFAYPTGVDYINFHRTRIVTATNAEGQQMTDDDGKPIDRYVPIEGDPLGPMTNGEPYILAVATHLLNVSITGGGKSNAQRAMVYSGYPRVMARIRENWICDLKRGVEATPMQHCFARVEDGKDGPAAVLRFWTDVRDIMWHRLDEMTQRGVVEFTPTPGILSSDVYFDEMAILQTVAYTDYRKAIYATISEVLVQGRAAKVRIRAFTQKSKLDDFPLRDDFPETHLGKVKTRRQIAMAMDPEAYDRGARASDINSDQPGIYYAETESAMAPVEFRVCETTIADMRSLPQCPASALYQPPPPVEPHLPQWGGFDGHPASNGHRSNRHRPVTVHSQNGSNGASSNGQHSPAEQPAQPAPKLEPIGPKYGGFGT